MARIALKGQCDLVYIMVPPTMSINEKFSKKKEKFLKSKNIANLLYFAVEKLKIFAR